MRFRLRTLILATTAAAVLAAVAGPIYRSASPGARAELVTFWGAASCVAILQTLSYWWTSYRLARIAGPTRYRLRRPDAPTLRFNLMWGVSPVFWSCLLLFLWAAMLFIANTLWLTHPMQREVDNVGGHAFGGFVIGLMLCGSITILWSRYGANRLLKFCDHGVVVDGRVLPWSAFVRSSWHFLHPTWLMLSTWTRPYAAEVPPLMRDDIEAFLRGRSEFDDEQSLPPPRGRGDGANWPTL